MSDFFARLVARHQGREQGLQARVPGMFEPEGGATEGFVEEVEERIAPPPPVTRPQTPAEAPPQAQDAPAPPEPNRETIEPRAQRDAPESPESRIVERETRVETQRELRDVTADTHVRETRVTHADHHIETRYFTERVHDAPDAPKPVTRDDVPVSEASEPLTEAPAQPVPLVEPTPLPVPRVARLPEQTEPASEPLEPPERRVEVHIGHLEIRQAPAPKPRPRKRASPANPAPDLNSYLGRRRP